MTACTTHHCTGEAEYCHDCLQSVLDTSTDSWLLDRREREGMRSLLRYLDRECVLSTNAVSRITGLDRATIRELRDYSQEPLTHGP